MCWAALVSLEGVRLVPIRASAHVGLLAVAGFSVSALDGILTGQASTALVRLARPSHTTDDMTLAVSGIVCGTGSFGAMMQGPMAAWLVPQVGWAGLFFVLGAAAASASVALSACTAIERMSGQHEGKTKIA